MLDRKLVDTIVTVSDFESTGRRPGIGGAGRDLHGCFRRRHLRRGAESCRDGRRESVVLAMLPDTGERYLSTFLFEGINEGTDEV